MQWSETIEKQARDYIKKKLPVGAFIGIHLRNGIDWVRCPISDLNSSFTVELHLLGLIGTAGHPDMQKIGIIGFFFESRPNWQFESRL